MYTWKYIFSYKIKVSTVQNYYICIQLISHILAITQMGKNNCQWLLKWKYTTEKVWDILCMGVYSQLDVPKYVISLSVLNKFALYPHVKMLLTDTMYSAILFGDQVMSPFLKYPYFHIIIDNRAWKYLWFALQQKMF